MKTGILGLTGLTLMLLKYFGIAHVHWWFIVSLILTDFIYQINDEK